MEINANLNLPPVSGVIPPARSTAVGKKSLDMASFAGTAGLESALENLPESRPEAVAGARESINDPNFPSPEMVGRLAEFLACNLNCETEPSSS
jgi:hypothetical protein